MGLDRWSFKDGSNTISVKVKCTFSTGNGEAIRDACSNGIGITINSTWSAYKQLQSGELIEVLSDYLLVANTAIWVLYPSSRMLAPKVRAFIDYYLDYFGDTPYWDE